jgi:CRP-like cAMP-binding protein
MAKDHYIQRLKTVPLFSSLSKKELNLLLGQADNLRYPPRFRVVQEGTQGEELWLVVDGELAVHRGGHQVASLGPGDYFGELSVIDSSPRDATVISTTPVELLVIGRRRFWATIQGSPTLMRKLMIGLANRLHEADRRETASNGRVATTGSASVRQKASSTRG